MQSKGASGWQPEKWSYLKRSRTVINEIIALCTLIHVHALGGDLSSPFDLCVSACILYAHVRVRAWSLCVFASNQSLSLTTRPVNHLLLELTAKVFIILSDLLFNQELQQEM